MSRKIQKQQKKPELRALQLVRLKKKQVARIFAKNYRSFRRAAKPRPSTPSNSELKTGLGSGTDEDREQSAGGMPPPPPWKVTGIDVTQLLPVLVASEAEVGSAAIAPF